MATSSQAKSSRGASSSGASLDGALQYPVTNENWRGKNDPAERRRIQNRINQRAFRQRQRAGETAKQYAVRGKSLKYEAEDRSQTSSGRSHDGEEYDEDDDEEEHGDDAASEGNYTTQHDDTSRSNSTSTFSVKAPDLEGGMVWDELARLINRNFNEAAVVNAQWLGITLETLQLGASIVTARPALTAAIPMSLWPVEAQHRIPHDPYIDAIPHARLRFNILSAIYGAQLDPLVFAAALRSSGALELFQGVWQRSGLVVWNTPSDLGSWEITEAFWRRWPFLLEGCEDLMATTNAWRTQRGEQPFTVPT